MANLQIGNRLGLTARGTSQLLATITADGANSFTVDTVKNLWVGMPIQVFTRATGASVGVRNVTGLNSATLTVTYDGADMAVTAADGVYRPASWAGPPTNLNGGSSFGGGLVLPGQDSVDDMRARLQTINPTYYTNARLDALTHNDVIYALRLADAATSV